MRRILYSVVLAMIGFVSGAVFIIYCCGYILENKRKSADKFLAYYKFFDQWLNRKEQDYNFADYFYKHNINTVAIYGMGRIGKHLKYELDKAGIEISYVIDEGEKVIYDEETHYNLKEALPPVDMVVVTPFNEFEEIKNKILDNNRELKVVSVEKIIG